MNVAYNTDCLTAMREYPENYFDLAVCDPPYGNALTDEVGLFNRCKEVSRTGGTWAAKFGKKIITWDVAPKKSILNSFFAYQKIKLFGAATTLTYHQQDVS